MPQLIATSPRQAGVAIIDASTVAHFGIGAAAGLSGIDPKMALLVALVAEGAYEVVKHRDPEAIFERGVGQSKINEIVDLLSMVLGAYAGQGIRHVVQQQAAPTTAPPAPVPAPAQTVVAGLGATTTNYRSIWSWNRRDGWYFIGYAPSQSRADQVIRALNYYYLGEPRDWFGSYPTNYVVNPKAVWPGWYRMIATGRDGRKYDYGWYGSSYTRRVTWALRMLLSNSVNTVVAVNNDGNGFRALEPSWGFYSYTEQPEQVTEATVRDAVA